MTAFKLAVILGLLSLLISPISALRATRMSRCYMLLDQSDNWIKEMGDGTGIKVKNVNIKTVNGIRGIVANSVIDKNIGPIVSVDANLALEITNDRPPTPFPELCPQSLWEESMWDQRLAFKLINEIILGNKSPKYSWIKQLPSKFTTTFQWNDNILNELQYDVIINKVYIQRQDWKENFKKWKSATSSNTVLKNFTYDDYVYALECVNSRAFSGIYEGSNASQRQQLLIFTAGLTVVWPLLGFGTVEQSLSAAFAVALSLIVRDVFFSKVSGLKRYVMCPYIDMFNHKSTVASDVSYNYFNNQFEVIINNEAYTKDQEVFISYGKQSNDRLLQYYGFIEQNCPFDVYDYGVNMIDLLLQYGDELGKVVPYPTQPSPKERLQQIASALKSTQVENNNNNKKVVNSYDLTTRYFRTSPPTDNIITNPNSLTRHFDELSVRCLRALYSSADEWQSICTTNDQLLTLDKLGQALSPDTESKVFMALKNIASQELSKKKSTIDEDYQLLANLGNKNGFAKAKQVSASDVKADGETGALATAIEFRIEKKKMLEEINNYNT